MDLFSFIKDNYTWVFSGIGVLAVTLVINIFLKKSKSDNIIQNNAKGIQSQGDIRININDKNK